MATNTSGGTTVSFSNTPQAKDDSLTTTATGALITEDSTIVYLDVMANDLGGNAKSLWSLDDGSSGSTSTKIYAPADLLAQDTARTEAISTDFSAKGAHIWITADGKVGYDTSTFGAAVTASLQALAVGETLSDTFTYAIRLGNGTLSWATSTVVFAGTNDIVSITSAPQAGTVTEDADTTSSTTDALSASGTMSFSDADLSDTHTASFVAAAGNTTSLGTFALAAVSEVVNAANGSVQWTYNLDNTAAQYLAQGQSVTETYVVTINDGHGSTTTQNVVITINGTNDSPVITSAVGANAGTAVEAGNLDDGTVVAGDPDASGTLSSSDVDTGATATWSGDAAGTYGSFAIDANTGAWTYTLDNADADTDALGEGTSVTDSFIATVTDNFGATATQNVIINITGANDQATITGDTTGTVSEDNVLQAAGQLNVTDVDHGEAHVQAQANVAGHYGAFSIDANGAWTYTLDNNLAAVQALNTNESLTDSFAVVSQDGTATQDVVVTIDGLNDHTAPIAVDDTATQSTGGTLGFEFDWSNYSYSYTETYDTNGNTTGYYYTYTDNNNSQVQYIDGYNYSTGVSFSKFVENGFQFTDNGGGNYSQGHYTFGPYQTGYWGADYSGAVYSGGYKYYYEINPNSVNVAPIEMTRVDGGVFAIDTVNITAYNYNSSQYEPTATFTETVTGFRNEVEVARESFAVPDANYTGIRNNVVDLLDPDFSAVDRVEFTQTAQYNFNGYYAYAYQWIDNIVLGGAQFNVIANDSDLTATINAYDHTSVLGAAITLASSGDMTYDASNSTAVKALIAGEHAVDTFNYNIIDAFGAVSNTATVSVNVFGVNDLAVITGATSGSVVEDGVLQVSGQLTITDPDHGESHAQVAQGGTSYGSYSVAADGTWAYQLDNSNAYIQSLAQNEQISDSFMVSSQDGTAHQQIQIDIAGTNDAPVAVSDTKSGAMLGFEFDWSNYSYNFTYTYDANGNTTSYYYTYTDNNSYVQLIYGYDYSTGVNFNKIVEGDFQFTDNGGGNYSQGNYTGGPYQTTYWGADYSGAVYSYGYKYNYEINPNSVNVAPIEMTRVDGGVFAIDTVNITAYNYNYNYDPTATFTETVIGFRNGVEVARESFAVPDANYTGIRNNVVDLLDPDFSAVDRVEFTQTAQYNSNGNTAYAYQWIDNILLPSTPAVASDITVLANDTDIDHNAVLSVGRLDALSAMGAQISLNGDGSLHYDPTQASRLADLNARDSLTDLFTYQAQDQFNALSGNTPVMVNLHGTTDTNVFYIHNGDVEHFISGFTAGSQGDVLDLRELLAASSVNSSNLAEYLQVSASGSDTQVFVDADGVGSGAAMEVATLLNVNLLLPALESNNVLFA